MFITTPEAELSFLNNLFGCDGLRHWSHVEIALNKPWFCVDVRHEEEGVTMGRTFHLTNPTLLITLTDAAADLVEGVEIVLPPHMTGKHGRTILPLRAIWRGVAPEGTAQYVYITTSGKRFSDCETPLHERDLTNPDLLFKLRAPRAR